MVHSEILQFNRRDGVIDYEFIWQLPMKEEPRPGSRARPPAALGILLLTHACGHSAKEWFPKSLSCPKCLGLPESMSIVDAARSQLNRFAILAVTAGDEASRCFSYEDAKPVADIIKTFRAEQNLRRDTRIFGLGVAAGGSFLSMIARRLEFAALSLQAASIRNAFIVDGFPPIEFLVLEKDTFTTTATQKNLALLRKRGIDSFSRQCVTRRIYGTYFSDRTGEQISALVSKRIFHALRQATLIDADGFLRRDPRATNWGHVVSRSLSSEKAEDLLGTPETSALHQLLNIAWAAHETCGEQIQETMVFFKKHDIALSNSASRPQVPNPNFKAGLKHNRTRAVKPARTMATAPRRETVLQDSRKNSNPAAFSIREFVRNQVLHTEKEPQIPPPTNWNRTRPANWNLMYGRDYPVPPLFTPADLEKAGRDAALELSNGKGGRDSALDVEFSRSFESNTQPAS